MNNIVNMKRRSYSKILHDDDVSSSSSSRAAKAARLGGGGYDVYVVLPPDGDEFSYSIHKINPLNKYGEKASYLPKPILKLPSDRFPPYMGFFAVGCKIYMFGGGLYGRTDQNNAPSTRCYVFDTRHEFCIDSIITLPALNSTKYEPIVLGPVKDGKYYALSDSLGEKDLEEFDTVTQTWTALPPPPILGHALRDKGYTILASAVVKSKLILATKNHGIYTFDVVSQEWEHVIFPKRHLPFGGRAEFINGLWYGSWPCDILRRDLCPHSIDEYNVFKRIGIRGLRKCSRILQTGFGSSVVVPLGDRMFCVVRSGFSYISMVDFYIDVDTYEVERRNQSKYSKDEAISVSLLCSSRYVENQSSGNPVICLAVETCM